MTKLKFQIIFFIILLSIPFIAWAQLEFDVDDFLIDFFDNSSNVAVDSLELIWSADTYAPYQYQGRKLPSSGSKVTIEALTGISGGSAYDLKYSWFMEDIFQRTKSGYGKTTFSFNIGKSPGDYHTIRVQIFNEDRSVFEEKSIKIPIVSPELIVYSTNGNSYFSDQASNLAFVLVDKKFSFIARPYFFSIEKMTDLNFEWQFANQDPIISSAYDANILDLTISGKDDDEILERSLWVNVNNKNQPRQRTSQTINLRIY